MGNISNRPSISLTDYVRVTRLEGKWFIPLEYKGTKEEEDREGKTYSTHIFSIYMWDEGYTTEFRATDRWLSHFNSYLTQEKENLIENEEIAIMFEIKGYGRQTKYEFKEKEINSTNSKNIKEEKRSKKQKKL